MTRRGRVQGGKGVGLRDDFGGDDFAGTAPGGETVDDHNAGLVDGFFEVLHAVGARCMSAVDLGF